ncbi:MAG: GTPase ObgE [Bacillota bacterium]|nr:MAG: GTPase ObgE [Bacillota bacterium]
MFVDEATIYVRAGNGGDGLVHFRREKHVPRGGPSGGDGGKGGDVVLAADLGLRTLLDFRYRRHFVAPNGQPGGPKNQAGRNGDDLVVPVPQGTVVYDAGSGRLIGDLTTAHQREVVARGGRGGRGNARFASSTERAPRYAEKGEPGEELTVRLELKLIADAGLVGLPNAGKSTFLSRVSAARPKIASYPFTTLVPNLGVVAVPGRPGEDFVLADIPGLIRGAHSGAGLGDRFLRHVERTRVIVHLVDVSPLGEDPVQAYEEVRKEMELYDPGLVGRPEIVVATKVDMAGHEERASLLERHVKAGDPTRVVLRASPLTGEGVTKVILAIAGALAANPPVERAAASPADVPEGDARGSRDFIVEIDSGVYVVRGPGVERLVLMTDLENEEALRHLDHVLRRRGVFRRLKSAGARHGSPVRIGSYEFEFVD